MRKLCAGAFPARSLATQQPISFAHQKATRRPPTRLAGRPPGPSSRDVRSGHEPARAESVRVSETALHRLSELHPGRPSELLLDSARVIGAILQCALDLVSRRATRARQGDCPHEGFGQRGSEEDQTAWKKHSPCFLLGGFRLMVLAESEFFVVHDIKLPQPVLLEAASELHRIDQILDVVQGQPQVAVPEYKIGVPQAKSQESERKRLAGTVNKAGPEDHHRQAGFLRKRNRKLFGQDL